MTSPNPTAPAAADQPELIVSRYTSEKTSKPRTQRGTFPDLVELMTSHQHTICTTETCAGKDCEHKRGSAYAPHELAKGTTRASENVVRVWAAIFDIDAMAPAQLKALVERLKSSRLTCALASTHSDRPRVSRFVRLALDLSRPALPSEWPGLWASINATLELQADPKAQDLGRLYFDPTCPADVKPLAWSQVGEPVDVDLFMLDAPLTPQVERKGPLSGGEWVTHLKNLGEGNRDNGLTQLAGLLIRELPPALAEQLIHLVNEGRCKPPLEVSQVDKIVGSVARREAKRLQGAR